MDAPQGPADFEQSDELQRLRRRACGPDADIAEDAGVTEQDATGVPIADSEPIDGGLSARVSEIHETPWP